MKPHRDFPRLTQSNHRNTSQATANYNCVAWAMEDTGQWWQPGMKWLPKKWPKDDTGIGALEAAFLAVGYVDCGMNASLEKGFIKVALYAISGLIWTHAARQLPNGKWTSKLGKGIDIEHDSPADVTGNVYGEVQEIMKRPIT
jgi:hypothetical protein